MQNDVTPYVPSELGTITKTCLSDSNILTPLKLENQLAFACEMDDTYTSLAATDFAAFKTLTSAYGAKVSDYGLRDFGYSSTTSRELLATLNSAVSDMGKSGSKSFTQENVIAPWSVYSDNFSLYRFGGKNLSSGELPGWNYTASISEFADDYFTRLAAVRTSTVDKLMQSSGDVGKVLETIEKLRCSQSCGWINISFNSTHNSLCKDILGTTLAISLCVLFLVIFLIPMVVTGITMQKRLRGAKKGTYEQLERRLQAIETKTKEEARTKAEASSSTSKKIDLFKFKKNLDSA